jgi:hypothetical protein
MAGLNVCATDTCTNKSDRYAWRFLIEPTLLHLGLPARDGATVADVYLIAQLGLDLLPKPYEKSKYVGYPGIGGAVRIERAVVDLHSLGIYAFSSAKAGYWAYQYDPNEKRSNTLGMGFDAGARLRLGWFSLGASYSWETAPSRGLTREGIGLLFFGYSSVGR